MKYDLPKEKCLALADAEGSHDVAAGSLAALSGSVLTNEEYEILHHTEHGAAGGLYCGGGKEMDTLVAAGLMECAGKKSFVPDPYYRITSAGRAALRSRNADFCRDDQPKTSKS